MSDSYYVRSKGKVFGPFTFESLKTKAGKGHLKKTDQVSTDKSSWQPARRVEGLFPPPSLPPRSETRGPELAEPELVEVALIEEEPLEIAEPDEQTEWHYCLQGDEQTQGPISEAKLQRLFQSGRLPYDTLVWNETLTDWVEARRIPALNAAPAPLPAGPMINPEIPLIDVGLVEGQTYAGGDLPVPPLASASLILGILGIAIPVGIFSVLAVVFGHFALGEIKANRHMYQGEGMAKAGLIIGYVTLTVLLLAGSVWLIVQLARN